jgi:hypothetical protein
MAQDVATVGITTIPWIESAAGAAAQSRTHLGKFGIGGDDMVVIEGLPEGAE